MEQHVVIAEKGGERVQARIPGIEEVIDGRRGARLIGRRIGVAAEAQAAGPHEIFTADATGSGKGVVHSGKIGVHRATGRTRGQHHKILNLPGRASDVKLVTRLEIVIAVALELCDRHRVGDSVSVLNVADSAQVKRHRLGGTLCTK